jgi:2-polyprenyl-6-methoxyphenol hydroxylase-like FAD-dependent oxidoreductase
MSLVENEEDRMVVLQLGYIIQIMYRHCVEKYADYIDIRFNHRVVGTGQDEERKKAWVDVEIGEDGSQKKNERMEADYVVGCDGSSSAVRRSLFGREWPGQTFDCRFIVQNVFYDGCKCPVG